MKKLFLILLIFVNVVGFAQKVNVTHANKGITQGLYDKQRKKKGEWKEYEQRGELQMLSVGTYNKGYRVGEWKTYWNNGKLYMVGSYTKKGIPTGEWKFYNEFGILKEISLHDKGIWKAFYENGQLKSVGKIKNEREIGKWTYYHENGNLESTGTYNENGEKVGEWRYYTPYGIPIK